MTLLLRLAFRNVFRHPARSGITLAAIALGVAGLILVGGFVNDIIFQLGESVIRSQTGHLQVQRAGYFDNGTRSPRSYEIDHSDELVAALQRLPHVTRVAARVDFSGLLNNGRSDWAVIGSGVEPAKEARLGAYARFAEGHRLDDADADGTVIGKGVADALTLAVGDSVTLLATSREGALNSLDLRVVGIFQTFSREFDSRAVTIPIASARDLLLTHGVNTLVVGLDDTRNTQAVRESVERILPPGVVVKSWQELNDFYGKTVALYRQQFRVLEVIVLALILLSVANSINMTAFERTGEFGTMLALGNSNRMVATIFAVENLLLAFIGVALGLFAGCVVALVVSKVGLSMPPPPNSDLPYTAHIRLAPPTVLMAAVVGMLAALAASAFPALAVMRLSPSRALRAAI